MGALQRFEQRLEGVVNGVFARAFRSQVQPVEIRSALEREVDNRAAIVGEGRTLVPNDFVVELSPSDAERLTGFAAQLGGELAGGVRQHAERQGYSFIGPVDVAFDTVDELATGVFRVRSSARAGVTQAAPPPSARTAPAAAPSAELVVDAASYPLGATTVIGRGAEADLQVDDPGVSRRHAVVRVAADGTAVISDLGSTNGTRVDGRRVDEARLDDGARITVGSTTAVFRLAGRGRGGV